MSQYLFFYSCHRLPLQLIFYHKRMKQIMHKGCGCDTWWKRKQLKGKDLKIQSTQKLLWLHFVLFFFDRSLYLSACQKKQLIDFVQGLSQISCGLVWSYYLLYNTIKGILLHIPNHKAKTLLSLFALLLYTWRGMKWQQHNSTTSSHTYYVVEFEFHFVTTRQMDDNSPNVMSCHFELISRHFGQLYSLLCKRQMYMLI
jgi:hypothetical protein